MKLRTMWYRDIVEIDVRQEVDDRVFGMARCVSQVEIGDSVLGARAFLARVIADMRRSVRAEIAKHG